MAKRSSVSGHHAEHRVAPSPGRAGRDPDRHRAITRRLLRGATMLVAASAAGAVFTGPHSDARAADPFTRPAAAAPRAPTRAGLPTNPDPARAVWAASRGAAPTGVAAQPAPPAPVIPRRPVSAAMAVALPPYGEGAPVALHAAVPPSVVASSGPVVSTDRLAFDRSLTWSGAGTLTAALVGLFVVGRRRRGW
jgi:hypothetical protein